MNEERIVYPKDKLRSWPGEMALTSEDIADLLAILSDYQAARPLLTKIRESALPQKDEEPYGELFMCATDEYEIVVEAIAYKGRSQPND